MYMIKTFSSPVHSPSAKYWMQDFSLIKKLSSPFKNFSSQAQCSFSVCWKAARRGRQCYRTRNAGHHLTKRGQKGFHTFAQALEMTLKIIVNYVKVGKKTPYNGKL